MDKESSPPGLLFYVRDSCYSRTLKGRESRNMLMYEIEFYMALLAVIITVGVLFRKSSVPFPLLLVLAGMLISFLPIPHITIDPDIILDIFLPLLLYEASGFSMSWRDVKCNLRPITMLSIGHVVFITVLVATTIHAIVPQLGWPLSFVLGAIVSPPDDVAILAIADKIQMPRRVVAILKGEAVFNDAAALTIYRVALAALFTHQFVITHSILNFIVIIIGETCYGMFIGYTFGGVRLRIKDPALTMLISLLTPFMAYIPAERMGGSGVIATVVAGLYIGHHYWSRYSADTRLTLRSTWVMLCFAIQSILFLLVGLNFHYTLDGIASIDMRTLATSALAVILAVIVGRFLWVFPVTYLPRLLSKQFRTKDPSPPWQAPFIISWAGMRGGISLAAAMAIPVLPTIQGAHPREFVIYLVFSVIVATLLVQGMSLSWILERFGIPRYGRTERSEEIFSELKARAAMTSAAISWLSNYQTRVQQDEKLIAEIKRRLDEYQIIANKLNDRLQNSHRDSDDQENNIEVQYQKELTLLAQVIDIEREELMSHWHDNKINLTVRQRLEHQLDLRTKHLEELAKNS